MIVAPKVQRPFIEVLTFLDGHPFAIRLAATYLKEARCGLLELSGRLKSEPRRLLSFSSMVPDRKTSLFRTLELSFEILPPDVKLMFPTLGPFPSGLTDSLVRAVFGENAVTRLEILFRHSMIEIDERGRGRRFRFLEPVRHFALEILYESAQGRADPERARALEFYNDAFLELFRVGALSRSPGEPMPQARGLR